MSSVCVKINTSQSKSTTLRAAFRQLSVIYAIADEDMFRYVFKIYLDFKRFLLSFQQKIVGVELFHHVGPFFFYRIQLVDVEPVRGLGCHTDTPPKWSHWVLASLLAAAKPVDALLLLLICFFMFPRCYFTAWPVASTHWPSYCRNVATSPSV